MADIIPFSRLAEPPRTDALAVGAHNALGIPWRLWLRRASCRRVLREELLPQPDSVLADAGISREAARREASKPFWKA